MDQVDVFLLQLLHGHSVLVFDLVVLFFVFYSGVGLLVGGLLELLVLGVELVFS